MKKALYKFLSRPVYFLVTAVARTLPGLKEDESFEAMPRSPVLPVALPVNIDRLPEKLAKSFVKNKQVPTRRIFILKDVWISRRTIVFKNLKLFLPSLPWLRDLPTYRKGQLLMKQWLWKPREILASENVVLAHDEWAVENYYHWMIESLPRLALIKKFYPDCLLIFPDPAKGYIKSTVHAMGFEKLLFFDRDHQNFLKVGNLVFPELVYYDEIKNPPAKSSLNTQDDEFEELIVTVKKQLLNFYCPEKIPKTKRTYISRSRQKKRRILNEEDIKPILKKYDFQIIYFEDLSFEEQIKVMYETEIVVGMHGANMVNILFMQEGARVVEIMNKDFLNDAYYLLASSTRLPYFSVPCTMADKSIKLTDDMMVLNDAHVTVDVAELEAAIKMAVEYQPQQQL